MEFRSKDRRLEGDTLLRQSQLTSIYLLDVFVEICEKHNLTYFLDAGTLIGAMRHNGFIPWDDDIDVGMSLEDYKKFLKIAPTEIPDNLLIQIPGKCAGKMEGFAKLMDRCSFFCLHHVNTEAPCGIYIDIFPFIRYPRFSPAFEKFFTHWSAAAWISAMIHKNLSHNYSIGVLISFFKSLAWMGIYYAIVGLTKLLCLFMPTVLHDHWTVCPCGIGSISVPESAILPVTKHIFEGKEYCIPHDPDAVLTQHYGDWRTLPPPEKRVWHSSIICPTQAPDAPWARKYQPPKD